MALVPGASYSACCRRALWIPGISGGVCSDVAKLKQHTPSPFRGTHMYMLCA